MFFYPWYPALMLAVESHKVIDMRLRKIAIGRVDFASETQLMISEKIDAAIETGTMIFGGGSTAAVIEFYRREVAAIARRLL